MRYARGDSGFSVKGTTMKHLLLFVALILVGCSQNTEPTASQSVSPKSQSVRFKPEPKPMLGYTADLYRKYATTKGKALAGGTVWVESMNDLEFTPTANGSVSITARGSVDVSPLINESGTVHLRIDGQVVDEQHLGNLNETWVACAFTLLWNGTLSAGTHTISITQDIGEDMLSTPKISVMHF